MPVAKPVARPEAADSQLVALKLPPHSVEAEQAGYDAHWDAPIVELNPVVTRLHDLTIRKWQAHLARTTSVAAGMAP